MAMISSDWGIPLTYLYYRNENRIKSILQPYPHQFTNDILSFLGYLARDRQLSPLYVSNFKTPILSHCICLQELCNGQVSGNSVCDILHHIGLGMHLGNHGTDKVDLFELRGVSDILYSNLSTLISI